MMAPVPIRVLILEDRQEDAELIIHELSDAGLEFNWQLVEDEAGYLSGLTTEPDLILADYSLHGFDALQALELLREPGLDIPFIIVSGTIGEETAVAAMRAGACDYIIKDNLARLPPAVQRELREAEVRRERREANAAVRSAVQKWQTTFDSISDGVCLLDRAGLVLQCNKAVADLLERPASEIVGGACEHICDNPDREGCSFLAASRSLHRESEVVQMGDRWFGIRVDPLLDDQGNFNGAVHIMSDITERKLTEQALQESEVRFREIAGAIQDAVIMVDGSARVTYWSPAAERIFGYPVAEAMGVPVVDLVIPGQLRGMMTEALGAFLKDSWTGDRTGAAFERPGQRKDGSVFPAEISFSKVMIGGVWIGVAVVRDITERKRAEDEVRLRAQMLDAASDSIFLHDLDGMIVYANETAHTLRGYSSGELVGKNMRTLLLPDMARAFDSLSSQILTGKELFFESVHLRKDGSELPVEVNARAIEVNGRNMILSISRDITARKRAEDDLRLRAQLLDAASDSIFLTNADGTVVYANEAAHTLRGYRSGELVGKNIRTLLDPKREPLFTSLFRKIMEGKEASFEAVHLRADGSELPIEVIARTIEVTGQKMVLSVSRDITERKRAEDDLRLRGQLLDAAGDSIFLHDPDGTIAYANEAAHGLRGYRSGELIGKNMRSLFPPDIVLEYPVRIHHMMAGNELSIESAHLRVDGSRLAVETIGRTIEVAGRKMVLGVSRDITDRKRMEEQLRQALAQTRAGFDGTVQAMASLLEIRDPYTAGHQKQMSGLACSIAREMGITEDNTEGVRVSGLLHDIGKISVPTEILSKPGRLSDSEFSLIKSHAQIGYDILKPIAFPWPVAEIVQQTHERMDGSGYPSGLRGDEILLEARILAIADVVEAMASHRPYRPALGIAAALEEISRGRGVLYDPDASDACIKVFAQGFKFE